MNAEINVTSLIDIAFTLLVIFIITAPILQGGLEIRLPRGELQPVTAQGAPFIVDIVDDNTVNIGNTPFTMEQFAAAFADLYGAVPEPPQIVYIRGDSRAAYGTVFSVMSTVGVATREDGVSIGLIGEPEPEPR
jgi:biopolymer transport protein ExbD/biopolymer transport protein TolR